MLCISRNGKECAHCTYAVIHLYKDYCTSYMYSHSVRTPPHTHSIHTDIHTHMVHDVVQKYNDRRRTHMELLLCAKMKCQINSFITGGCKDVGWTS